MTKYFYLDRSVPKFWRNSFRPLAEAMPPVFEPLQILGRIRHPIGQRLAAEGFVRPKMKMFVQAEFPSQLANRM